MIKAKAILIDERLHILFPQLATTTSQPQYYCDGIDYESNNAGEYSRAWVYDSLYLKGDDEALDCQLSELVDYLENSLGMITDFK